MAQAKYLDAAEDLRNLQGTGKFASLENPHIGSKEFAQVITESYRNDTLVKARQILDMEQDMQTLNENDPVGTTLEYGGMTRDWLTRQQGEKASVKHPMVTPEEPKEEPEDNTELANDIVGFLGKALPDDPNLQLLMWAELAELQKKLKTVEMEMRKKMSDHFFAKPKEGTNTADIGKGWKLKLKHTLNRSADEAAFEGVFEELNALDKGDPRIYGKEDLFKFKPDLKKKEYNKLSDKQKVIFDQCLVIKPGSPALELVAPKEEK